MLFYVVLVCKCVLPPGDNPIAVNKYYYKMLNPVYNILQLYLEEEKVNGNK